MDPLTQALMQQQMSQQGQPPPQQQMGQPMPLMGQPPSPMQQGPPPAPLPVTPPNPPTRVPQQTKRFNNAQAIQNSIRNGWTPNPVLLRATLGNK